MRLILTAILLTGIAPAETVTFDKAQLGALPRGWISAMTHSGGEPRWEVIHDDAGAAQVLAQLSRDKTSGRFPLAIYDNARLRDGEVSVRCKSVSGEIDQACGVVWRYRDPNNYYITRANALENNVVLYKVQDGERRSLAPKGHPSRAYGVKHPVPSGQWNELRVNFQGNLMTVFFNGQQLFQVEDDSFSEAGKVGLWTKADSVTYFDDFRFSGK
ncbi:MAG TPA: family 16 glycoside hydrolase [Bryobacteraceae bacterium]|nr:family 16 glycoside hydrolase [Bryobacteraceae bacterium]